MVWSDLRGAERAGELQQQGFFVAPQQAAAKLEGPRESVRARARPTRLGRGGQLPS